MKDVKLEELGQFLPKNDLGQQLRRGMPKLLDETNVKRSIVIVDDLGRCTPDTVIETLGAIKLSCSCPAPRSPRRGRALHPLSRS